MAADRKAPTRIRREGALSLYSQAGSFAAPDIMINGNSIGELVWDLFKVHAKNGKIGPSTGRWRFTLERIYEQAADIRGAA